MRSAYVRRVARAWPDVRRRAVRAGFHGAIRFVVRDGSYHAAALTYYSILFADLWPGYDTNYGVFATLIVAVIWLWLTNVSVPLGGAFAAEWERSM